MLQLILHDLYQYSWKNHILQKYIFLYIFKYKKNFNEEKTNKKDKLKFVIKTYLIHKLSILLHQLK